METLRNGFSIINADIAVGGLPTDKTLRIAKSLGYAAVLHDCGGKPDLAPQKGTDIRQRVEAVRLQYHGAALSPQVARAEVENLVARLPKPVLVVSHDMHRIADILTGATARTEPRHGDRADGLRPGNVAGSGRRAA